MKTVLVQVLVRNNQKWIPYFKSMLKQLETNNPDLKFDVWIYENDSIDNTKQLVKDNFANYFIEDFNHPLDNKTRTKRLALYRNNFKHNLKNHIENADYILLIDSNIFFGHSGFTTMQKVLDHNPDIAMVCPHATVKTSLPCRFFYDTFATICMDGTKCGQFTNVLECECDQPGHRHDPHCHKSRGLAPIHKANGPRLVELKSCFGGFVLLRPEAYKDAEWFVKEDTDCEHWQFCADIRKHGKIVLDRHAAVIWTEHF